MVGMLYDKSRYFLCSTDDIAPVSLEPLPMKGLLLRIRGTTKNILWGEVDFS
jgi:hypothetical protein